MGAAPTSHVAGRVHCVRARTGYWLRGSSSYRYGLGSTTVDSHVSHVTTVEPYCDQRWVRRHLGLGLGGAWCFCRRAMANAQALCVGLYAPVVMICLSLSSE
jgi:hypothetical protein